MALTKEVLPIETLRINLPAGEQVPGVVLIGTWEEIFWQSNLSLTEFEKSQPLVTLSVKPGFSWHTWVVGDVNCIEVYPNWISVSGVWVIVKLFWDGSNLEPNTTWKGETIALSHAFWLVQRQGTPESHFPEREVVPSDRTA